jgi:5-methylthioribose kinase
MSAEPAVELSPSTAVEYLAARGMQPRRVSELAGGVSNTVLLVETDSGRFVLKQSLPQLRVAQQWLSDRCRVWREASALEAVAPHLPQGTVPEVLFRDDSNYLFAMTAGPAASEAWKSVLMRGECDPAVASRVGSITAALMRSGWQSRAMEAAFGDLTVFEQLRLDPYYRTTASRHPDLAGFLNTLADTYRSRSCTLVHGDWSPKNFLVGDGVVMAIDLEAIHFGDPAFDSGFLLNHLLLKSFHLPSRSAALAGLAEVFWSSLIDGMPPVPHFEHRTLEHLGALLLSRVDGKSPAEYIADPDLKQRVRDFARRLILNRPRCIAEVFEWRG